MRRKDREITDTSELIEIIDACKVFRIAMSSHNIPYIVPLNYGYHYENESFQFYFHCANEGKKIEMLKENCTVCFEFDCAHELTTAEIACGYGYNYQSVIGIGEVSFVTDITEKMDCLRYIMKHQTGKDFSFTKEQVLPVTVCKVNVLEMTGKQRLPIRNEKL